jgi:hypothetical protein
VWWRYAEKQLAGQAVFRAAVFVIVLQRSIPGARLREKNENPARSCDRTGKSGDGSSPCSLSRADIRRSPRGGCRLPDAILHGKRSYRPRSRAVQRVTATGLLSEAFKLAWAGGCATGLRTRSRHACDFGSASRPHCPGTATTDGGALAPRDGSRLFTLRLPFAHKPAVPFVASPTSWKVFTGLAVASCPSRTTRSCCPAFRRLSFGESRFWNRQSRVLRAGTQ